MAKGRTYVDWKYVQEVIAENPNRPRWQLANLANCSIHSKNFLRLCNDYDVPKMQGKQRIQPEHYEPAPRPGKNAKTYRVKCPTCEQWWNFKSNTKPDCNRLYCHSHQYHRTNGQDQNTLYYLGTE